MTTAVVYRIGPLTRAAAYLGGTLAAAALSYFVYLPACYSLAAAARRAIFAWFNWYDLFFEWAEILFLPLVWAPLPFLFLATLYLGHRVARRLFGALSAKPGWLRRTAFWLVTILLALPSATALFAVLAVDAACYGPGLSPTVIHGAWLQARRCDGCHAGSLPLNVIRTPERWDEIVTRMRAVNGAPISEKQGVKVAAFAQLRGSYRDRWLMRAKCGRCHGLSDLDDTPRVAEEWNDIIDRVARTAPLSYRADWMAQLKRYAARRLTVSADEDSRSRAAFANHCGDCHSLTLVLDPVMDGDGRDAVLRRMAEKRTGRPHAEDLPAIGDYLDTLPHDPDVFGRLFPHDAPVELSW